MNIVFFDLGLLMMTCNVYLSHGIIEKFPHRFMFFSGWLRSSSNSAELNRILSHIEQKIKKWTISSNESGPQNLSVYVRLGIGNRILVELEKNKDLKKIKMRFSESFQWSTIHIEGLSNK